MKLKDFATFLPPSGRMIPKILLYVFFLFRILKSSKARKSFNTVSNSNLIYSSLVECNGNVDDCNSLSTKLTWEHNLNLL